jgi:hypothetical protein
MQSNVEIANEVERLRQGFLTVHDPYKEIGLLGAIQALSWALHPEGIAAPMTTCLDGLIVPITDIQAN